MTPSEGEIKCIDCGSSFEQRDEYLEHRKTPCRVESPSLKCCPICGKKYKTAGYLKRHAAKHDRANGIIAACKPKPTMYERFCHDCRVEYVCDWEMQHCPKCGVRLDDRGQYVVKTLFSDHPPER